MKAYQVVENGKPLEQREIETPEPQGNEVLLKTVACGVCHSDVHIHDGYFELGNDVHIPARVQLQWDMKFMAKWLKSVRV